MWHISRMGLCGHFPLFEKQISSSVNHLVDIFLIHWYSSYSQIPYFLLSYLFHFSIVWIFIDYKFVNAILKLKTYYNIILPPFQVNGLTRPATCMYTTRKSTGSRGRCVDSVGKVLKVERNSMSIRKLTTSPFQTPVRYAQRPATPPRTWRSTCIII